MTGERRGSSVILTTHSMEEAEALAQRVGIMIDGELKCIGTLLHIKDRYGGGHEIEIKLSPIDEDLLSESI